MKGKKIVLVLVVGVFLALGWLLTLKKASGIDEINEQRNLVERADVFLSKKLYIRGIPLLEQALGMNVGDSKEIQRKLLQAYFDYDDEKSYIALLSDMSKLNNSTEEDYMRIISKIEERNDIDEALQIAKSGLNFFDEGKVKDFYEKYRYESKFLQLGYQKVSYSEDVEYLPSMYDNKWNYIDGEGRLQLQTDSESATPFNQSGFAVIKRNGRFETIVKSGELYGIDETGVEEVKGLTNSSIIAKKDGKFGYYNYDFKLLSESLQFDEVTMSSDGFSAVKRDGAWALMKDDGEITTDFIYEDVALNTLGSIFKNGRAMVKKGGNWILIDMEGKQLFEATFKEAKAPESTEYIAVGDGSGKWGFIDHEGNKVIDFKYEDAKSFSNGLAAVKENGFWKYISKADKIVIDELFDEAESFLNGKAVVYTKEGAAVLSLKYFNLE